MPIKKVKGGYKWGEHGKVYPSRSGAEKQMKAAFANGWQGKAKGGVIDEEEKKTSSKTPAKKSNSKKPKGK